MSSLAPGRLYALFVSVALAALVLSPLNPPWRGVRGDSFPLSWFPMFREERPKVETPVYMIALEPNGKRHKVHTGWWSSGGFNQGRNQLAATAGAGNTALDAFCERIARKVATHEGGSWAQKVEELQIIRGQYSLARYFGERKHAPNRETILARCMVVRG